MKPKKNNATAYLLGRSNTVGISPESNHLEQLVLDQTLQRIKCFI